MKRGIIYFSIISAIFFSLNAATKSSGPYLKSFVLVDKFGKLDSVDNDTSHLNFQYLNAIDKYSIANSFNATLGSPLQSKVFEDRVYMKEFFFANAYLPYLHTIDNTRFYNTKTPFSSLYYLSGGTNYHEEEQISFTFTANAKKELNFGTKLDYIYSRGEYQNNAAKRFAGSFWGMYTGDKYQAAGLLSSNNISNFENGGIKDTSYINGSINYPTENIPVNIKGFSNLKLNQLYFTHQYALGTYRFRDELKDSATMYFVPVTKFYHTLKIDDVRKRYYESSVEKEFYKNTYVNTSDVNDSALYQSMTNTFAVSIEEEFNRWMNFGVKAFVENNVQRYGMSSDSVFNAHWMSNSSLGAVLSKDMGRIFRYRFSGQLTFIGPYAGEFDLNGKLGGYFRLWGDSLALVAKASLKNLHASYFEQKYISSHFQWANQFGSYQKMKIGGMFALPTRNMEFNLAVENITNPIYFDENAMPVQFGNVQLLSADLFNKFKLGKLALESRIIYQLSSNQSIVPLPEISTLQNLYYDDLWFKVLSVQLGVDMRYHTSYFAPSYMPAIGVFYNQSKYEIGNYPVFNVYLNAHLKRTRFFAQMYHVNELFMKGDYYSMPMYPINPALFKMGLSWNFYD